MKVLRHPKAIKEMGEIKEPKVVEKMRRRLQGLEMYGTGQMRKAGELVPIRGEKVPLEELKFKGNKTEYRLLGGILTEKIYAICLCLQKKKPRLDRGEIKTAIARYQELELYL